MGMVMAMLVAMTMVLATVVLIIMANDSGGQGIS